jgi:hypothetical protein
MAASRVLPARPSLESIRKQAKKLARDSTRPLPLRDAQLAIAREYGFAGWRDLIAEVLRRMGRASKSPQARPAASFTTMTPFD